ncbi:MAG: 50S ribosomal protein L31 [Elusimicrobiota bacterium]
MKEGIHPDYVSCAVTCVCGNSFTTRSTKSEIKLDICSKCHPFFTGKQKLVDTAGRVDKFLSKYSTTGGKAIKRKPKEVVMKIKPLKKIKKAVPKDIPKKGFAKKSDVGQNVKKEVKPKDTTEK